ncbi:ribose-5-phosphate isomerase RpiA [Sphingomonas solaris]|uniref:Ribose-5-phosphate isomerase A n=1 Tax=Alterirhizorhabdus solaris TaxID=2529389 RepID=A0A558R730_9SPHN|nr:ribose-5-phosphate isomerase RpiA [Sphingomonas solaris]TVV75128.1 ribose-5-phosphate isomerase RpiA [Sphingomonas solaris]
MHKPLPDRAEQKRLAAEAAVGQVADGMIVGIGTGSTAAYAIAALGRRVGEGLRVTGVATSLATAAAARAAGIAIVDLAPIDRIDLCIDGVDEIDAGLRAIKGAGGAMLREKIVAAAADRMIAIADETKRVGQLGRKPVPVEVLPMAQAFVVREIARLGGDATVRCDPAGTAVRSDQGNIIIDAAFGAIADPAALATALSTVPGILGHGLFLVEIDTLYLGTADGVVTVDRDRESGEPPAARIQRPARSL